MGRIDCIVSEALRRFSSGNGCERRETGVAGALKRFSFPKTSRLVSNSQFKAVLAGNLRASNGMFTLFAAENHRGLARFGVSVSKSCGKAVIRNRLKRLAREAFRRSQIRIPCGFDYVLIVSAPRSKKSNNKDRHEQILRNLTLEQLSGSFVKLVLRATGGRDKKPNRPGGAGEDINGG